MEKTVNLLEEPSYGWADENGELIKPSVSVILKEFFYRINIFRDRKNWLSFIGWFWLLCLLPFFLLFFTKGYFSFPLLAIGFLYSMVVMGSHGTFWYHRYCTHSAFTFKNKFWKFIGQHLVIKVVPEEVYVLSHHVHHAKSDLPGDPYNAFGGFFYCFFADVNHQQIKRGLSEEDYKLAVKMMAHTGCPANSYEQYLKQSSLVPAWYILGGWILNWAFWMTMFYLIGTWTGLGGVQLIVACFAGAFVWSLGIRTFNYDGHGKGAGAGGWGKHDLNRKNYSINQVWPGYVAGEWHNNHHLFPTSSRSGFLNYQIDIPYYLVRVFHFLGGITDYRDNKKQFIDNYYKPFKETARYKE